MELSGAARRVQQFVCGLHGHDVVRHFDKGRVSLQCVSCGHESPGWQMPELAVRRTMPTSPNTSTGHTAHGRHAS